MPLQAQAISGLGEILAGDDLAELILASGARLQDDDVVVIAHKAISKSEGRVRALAAIEPGAKALELADMLAKDARQVQAILDESAEIVRTAPGVLICRTHHGFVCANAGVDASNTAADDELVLLPLDPDASARTLRAGLHRLYGAKPAVIVTDSFGRAWRNGQCDLAIGVAGMQPLTDWRGLTDSRGRELHATWIATADQIAAAADLVRGKDSREPVILVRGMGAHVTAEDGPGARALVRPSEQDLFL